MSDENKEQIVITPGGPRPASTIHTVQSTDTVRLDETGFSVTSGGAKAVPAPDLVVTPGGPRLRSLIHNVESGYTLRVDPGNWEIMDLTGTLVKSITPPPLEDAPGLGTGWICATFWNNNTGSPISLIRTTWSVPPFPTTQSGQLIYLFNGIQVQVTGANPAQTGLHILQPVLQWGVSPDGGGNAWAVASWFVGSPSQPVAVTPLTTVSPGQLLTGVITLTGQSGGLLNYRCEFSGFANSVLNVQMPAPFQAVETLECYGIQKCSDYPRTAFTQMRAISVSTQAGVAPLVWDPQDFVTDCEQSIRVISSSATNGEVDILYPPISFLVRILETGTTFLPETDGTWLMTDYDRDGIPDLVFIKTSNTGTGKVEVHIASGASKYQTRILETGTTFAPETDGTWLMADYDRDGIPDLVFIKTSNTGTGKVEVHIASGASKYQTRILETGTTFAPETDGTWLMADYDRDGIPDLVFVKTSNTGTGRVEVHVASGASKYQTRILETGTTFFPETDGTWLMTDYDRDGIPDLAFIKTSSNTGTLKVEVHIASGVSKYQTRILETGTTFLPETDGTWLMADYNRDGIPDLVFVKTSNTGTGKVEVHVAAGTPL
jgi:hypothetical protein